MTVVLAFRKGALLSTLLSYCFLLLVLLENNASAFSLSAQRLAFRRSRMQLYDAPPSMGGETLQVSDIEEAVEFLQQHQEEIVEPSTSSTQQGDEDDEPVVIIENEMPSVSDLDDNIDRQELTSEIEEILLENDVLAPLDATKLAGSIQGLFQRFQQQQQQPFERTAEEAAISASLYMNPLTEKIASHLTVTWEPEVAELLTRLNEVKNPGRPLMVGIVGIPGSGKSTSSDILAKLLGDHALVMPMDGFHLSLEQLSVLPNSADAIYRRGAPDTFDPAELDVALDKIAYDDVQPTVTIPGFDHAMGDPVPDQHTFERENHQIVLCEGIYLLHDNDGWETIKSFFDWTIYIDANVDVCIERLKERNKCIPGYTPEEIETRCDVVDRKNAEMSRDSAYKYASQIVKSGASSS